MKYQYEREAARGDPMPEGLTMTEQATYQGMRYLYAVYRAGRLTKEAAAREKAAMLRELNRSREREDLRERLEKKTAAMWKAVEAAGNRYGTERTLENADAFVEAVYGVRPCKRIGDGITASAPGARTPST